MQIKKPVFWSKINIISILLFPFTFIFLCLSSLNNSLKKKYFLKVPTIFIGNIYVGGTGKTPLSIHIFKLLKKKGWKPAIIKKFYKNHIDEVNLIRQKVNSLFTGKNRVDLSEEAIRKGHRLLIFDDGLQDASINKDLKIICFNSDDLIGNGFLFPAGPLREKINSIEEKDIVVINGNKSKNLEKKISSISKEIKIFYSYYEFSKIKSAIKKRKILAFSGIGNPQSFFSLLKKNKFNVVEKFKFPDHYMYKDKDLKKLIDKAKKNNLQLLTTEKDFHRIKYLFKRNIDFLKINLKIKKEKEFFKELSKKI